MGCQEYMTSGAFRDTFGFTYLTWCPRCRCWPPHQPGSHLQRVRNAKPKVWYVPIYSPKKTDMGCFEGHVVGIHFFYTSGKRWFFSSRLVISRKLRLQRLMIFTPCDGWNESHSPKDSNSTIFRPPKCPTYLAILEFSIFQAAVLNFMRWFSVQTLESYNLSSRKMICLGRYCRSHEPTYQKESYLESTRIPPISGVIHSNSSLPLKLLQKEKPKDFPTESPQKSLLKLTWKKFLFQLMVSGPNRLPTVENPFSWEAWHQWHSNAVFSL